MNKSRAYKAVAVNTVEVDSLRQQWPQQVWMGLDVGKYHVFAVLRWGADDFERPWRVDNPTQILELVRRCHQIARRCGLVVALEPSGTYGDALRQAFETAALPLHLVKTKYSHDYAEIFDGTPSRHDGKDAAVLAELASQGKAQPWPFETPPSWQRQLHNEVDWYEDQRHCASSWRGRLEGLLARHWPELTGLLPLCRVALTRLLTEFGGPQRLAEDPRDDPLQQCCPRLSSRRRQQILDSARRTLGVRQDASDVQRVQRVAKELWQAQQHRRESRRLLAGLCEQQPVLLRMAQVVGPTTACALFAYAGDPARYHCAQAYRKALGLNLKERSSGTYKGQLKITKRGPALARYWLYLSALRWARSEEVGWWYQAKKGQGGRRPTALLVALMRKLALALYRVAAEEQPFDPGRLFAATSR